MISTLFDHGEDRRGRPSRAPETIGDARGAMAVAANDPFFDARAWGAPWFGTHTAIEAPFGWIGLVRLFAGMCADRMPGPAGRILALSISKESGICLDVDRCGADAIIGIHSLAAEIGRAATAVDAETGLLSRSSLEGLAEVLSNPSACELALEHAELTRLVSSASNSARVKLVGDVELMRSGYSPLCFRVPFLRDWRFAFPPRAVTVEIQGEVGRGRRRRSVSEPLVAIDRLRRFARTTSGLYRLRLDEPLR